jgi:hypothetical protein
MYLDFNFNFEAILMPGFQGLVDGACGNVNPLMKLTTHFTQDKAKAEFLRTSNLQNGIQNREGNSFLWGSRFHTYRYQILK